MFKYAAPVALAWTGFAGSHILMSSETFRPKLVEKFGKYFPAVYSGVAVATGIPLVVTYYRGRGIGPVIHTWGRFKSMQIAAAALKTLAAVTFAESFVTPSPLSGQAQGETEPHGLVRITRHPQFAAFSLWGLGNVLVRGNLPELIFWAGFPVFWYFGSLHQDQRKRKELPAEFFRKTSVLPFQAIVEGRQSLEKAVAELSPTAAAGGLALAAAMYGLKLLRR